MTIRNRLFALWNIVKTALLITVVVDVLFFFLYGFNETTLRTMVRLTARMSGLLFTMAFGASAFHLLAHNSFSQWMLKNRRYLGISFALVHLIHLAFILLLQSVYETVLPNTKLFTIVGGGIAYVFAVAMLFTSFPRFSSRLSKKQWKMLHTTGGYWIWAVFMFSYLKRAKVDYLYVALALLFAALLLIRLFKTKLKQRRLEAGA